MDQMEAFGSRPEPKRGPGSRCGNPKCRKILPPGISKKAAHCNEECRKEHARCDAEDRRVDRAMTALEFAERYPECIENIVKAIKRDAKAMKRKKVNGRIRFRFYWENFVRCAILSGHRIFANDHHEKTIKELILNRYPEMSSYIRMKGE